MTAPAETPAARLAAAAPLGAGSWSWSREPSEWHSHEPGGLTWRCDGGSDFPRHTSSGAVKDDGNAYLTAVDGGADFVVSGHFDADLGEQYDQLGVLVYGSPERWLKAGAELVGEVIASVVHTRGDSDSSVGTGLLPLVVRIERRSETVEVYAGRADTEARLIRQLRFEGPVSVGPYSCAPQGEGFLATATGFELAVEVP